MRNKFIPTGQLVDYDGNTLLVTATKDNKPVCAKCFFSNYERRKAGKREFSCFMHGLACTANMREDNKHVVFIKQKFIMSKWNRPCLLKKAADNYFTQFVSDELDNNGQEKE